MTDRLLIVDDEEIICTSLKGLFSGEGYFADTVHSAESALELLDEESYDLIITDIVLPGIDGIELVKKIKERLPEQIIIVITGYASLETSVKAFRAGAYDYVIKPIINEEIKQIVKNALRQNATQKKAIIVSKHDERHYNFNSIIGESPSIKRIISEVKKIADTRSNVLLLGETGTGKELISKAIHFNSSRDNKPFIPINCSAIPENLLESELFGHVKGSFTGAVTSKRGLFEEANGGTVFLDEIGDLSLGLQSKLLRVLEDRELRPVGGIKSIKVDIRFICATNKNIENAVKEGKFREDLFYRINVFTIKLPPLMERREDIRLLASYFIKKLSSELGKTVKDIDNEASGILDRYHWPGNIRELQNIIERAILIAEDEIIRVEHLSEGIREEVSFLQHATNKQLSIEDYFKEFIQKFQDEYTEKQLADMLGITRKSLWEKRKRFGITKN